MPVALAAGREADDELVREESQPSHAPCEATATHLHSARHALL